MDQQTKTWGPFTGRQLATMFVVAVIAVAVPVGANAVTGSNAFITDATSGKQAKVDASGNLQTKISSGSVTATRATPSQFARGGAFAGGVTGAPVIAPPTGKALVVSTVNTGWVDVRTDGYSTITIGIGAAGDCAGFASLETRYVATGRDFVTVPYEPGIPIPAGKALCARANVGGLGEVIVTAYGYLVSASAVPA